MADKKGVGSPLDEGVAKQLDIRAEVISSQNRNRNTLLFLNANKPWVRLSSGVNTLSDDEIEALEKSNRTVPQAGSSALAKKHTLGLLTTEGGIDKSKYTPTTRTQKGAIIDSQMSTDATYRYYDSIGYKPEPGIISATVRSKGSYGVLRETTVEFVVWTVEDLDLVEALYLRPGYTMLLEWGHSLYFDNKKEFQTVPFQFGDDFFADLDTLVSKQPLIFTEEERTRRAFDIEAKIADLRVKSGYNYDAVYGYVKNFSWDFRKTGGYTCTITIASKGTVIESLRVDRSPMDFIPASEFTRDSLDQYKEQQKSIFHYFLSRLAALKSVPNVITRDFLKSAVISTVVQESKTQLGFSKTEESALLSTFVSPLQDFAVYKYVMDKNWTTADRSIKYMPLSLVLDTVNNYLAKTKNGVQVLQFYTGQDTAVGQPYKVECKYTTSDYHFALDPTICLIAKPAITPDEMTQELGNTKLPNLSQLVKNGEGKSVFKHTKGTDDDILNIYITDTMLKPIADSFISSEQTSERNILSFVEAVLSKINDNLGGINELSLQEENGVYYIVDRKLTPKTSDRYPELNLTGLKSTVTDLQISSKLSNQVGSQIAIAAQGIDSNYTENISELLTWNLGVVDRFTKPVKVESTFRDIPQFYNLPSSTSETSQQAGKLAVWAKDLKALYDKFYKKNYEDEGFDELVTNHRDYTAKYVLSYQAALNEPEKGIIPIELSFTLLGISGITIAKAFKVVKGILPSKYSTKFGFIITGLEHEIGTQWLTKIKTQFYVLEQPSSDRVAAAKAQFNASANVQTGTTSVDVPGFSGETPQADRVRAVLPTLGYYEKGKELSSGGDITFEMANATIAVLSTIKSRLPNLTLTITAGNDRYHQLYSANSRHAPGRGVDFVISNPTSQSIAAVEDILLAFTAGNAPNFRYLNEYEVSTAYATGKHFHISWGAGTEGTANIAKARAAVLAGKVVPIQI